MNTPITTRMQIFMVGIFIDRGGGRTITDQLKDPGPAPKNKGSHAKVEQINNADTYSDASSEESSLGDDSSSQSGGPPGDDGASETGVSSEGIGGFGSL